MTEVGKDGRRGGGGTLGREHEEGRVWEGGRWRKAGGKGSGGGGGQRGVGEGKRVGVGIGRTQSASRNA